MTPVFNSSLETEYINHLQWNVKDIVIVFQTIFNGEVAVTFKYLKNWSHQEWQTRMFQIFAKGIIKVFDLYLVYSYQ